MKKLLIAVLMLLLVIACDDGDSSKPLDTDSDNPTVNDTDETDDTDAINDTETEDSDIETIDDADTEEETDADNYVNPEPVAGDCVVRTVVVGALDRTAIYCLPTDIENALPVVFAWHGLGDSANNFASAFNAKALADYENYNAAIIVPEDANLSFQTLAGVDWDVLNMEDDYIEGDFFDAILEDIAQFITIDENRIHTAGFSAGAINSDALATAKGSELASVFTWSGGYFNDSANIGTGVPAMAGSIIKWPELTTENKYVQVILHGDSTDTFSLGSQGEIKFNLMAQNDVTYLNEKGHDVIICNHGQGHSAVGLTVAQMMDFFKNHPKGTVDSPYSTLPSDYPETCEFKSKILSD